MTGSGLLGTIETCYDAIPRAAGTAEDVGPFTLFRAHEETGWQFYARPRLGSAAEFTADDVRRVVARQRELGVPRAIEWVDEVTPALRGAVDQAAPGRDLEECPLLALRADADVETAVGPGRPEVMTPDHPDLSRVVAVVAAGFAGSDRTGAAAVGLRPRLIASGALVVVAAYDERGDVVGGGSAAPRGPAAELMGIATLPSARRRGHGAAVTRALVRSVRATGAETVFLSAGSDDAASVYRRIGFARVGTAMTVVVPDDADQNGVQ